MKALNTLKTVNTVNTVKTVKRNSRNTASILILNHQSETVKNSEKIEETTYFNAVESVKRNRTT